MAKLVSSVMPASVSPAWLAKTYSEYLYACADDQIALNNAISDACSDEDLSTLIDGYTDVWDNNIDVINKDVSDFALSKGCTQTDIASRSTAFQSAMVTYQPSAQAVIAATSIAGKYSDTYQSYSDVIDDIINNSATAETHLAEQVTISGKINSLAQAIKNEFNLDSNYTYPLQDGYVNFVDLCKNLIAYANINKDDDEFIMAATGSQDESVGNITLNPVSVIDELKSTAASNIAWAQGFASCAIENLTDRITNFTQAVQTAFSSAYTEAKECFNNVKAILSTTACDVKTFIAQAENMLGWSSIIESNAVIGETDVSNYTGASPYAGMDLHTAKGIAEATAKTVAAAGKAIWEGMKAIGKKIWGKIRPYVKAITTDPEDLKVIDNTANSYQVENWLYNCESTRITIPFSTMAARTRVYNVIHDKFLNKTMAFDNYFSSMVVRIIDISAFNVGSKYYVSVRYSYQFKPKCVDYATLKNSGIIAGTLTYAGNPAVITTPASMVSALTKFSTSEAMYLNDDDGERKFATGFMAAIIATFTLGYSQLVEFAGQTDALNGWIPEFDVLSKDSARTYDCTDFNAMLQKLTRYQISVPVDGHYGSVTNLDFLKFLSGYMGTDTYASDEIPNDGTGQFQMFHGRSGNTDVADVIAFFLTFFIIQQNDRAVNPGDFLFLPYTTDTFDFATPRYAIKTDAENANITDIFISALVIVAVVAIAVLIGAKVAKTIKKAKFKKWTAVKGRLDNAIWNGKTLTGGEWRKYLRADRKLSKMNLWSAGTSLSNIITGSDPKASVSALLKSTSESEIMSSGTFTEGKLTEIRGLIKTY